MRPGPVTGPELLPSVARGLSLQVRPSLLSTAVANWKGLVPEERWWLYTQTAAATGHGVRDRGKGWRKAVRFALTENPITSRPPQEAMVPEFFRLAANEEDSSA